jgi:hypothetical protein
VAKRAKWVVVGFTIVLVIAAMTISGALLVKSEATEETCEGVNEVRSALIGILVRSQGLAVQNEEYTELEKEVAKEFYERAIEDLALKPC